MLFYDHCNKPQKLIYIMYILGSEARRPSRSLSISAFQTISRLINIFSSAVCQALPPLVNGRIVYSPDTTAPYLEGTRARHVCNSGFILNGTATRTCQNDNSFDGTPPTCEGVLEQSILFLTS